MPAYRELSLNLERVNVFLWGIPVSYIGYQPLLIWYSKTRNRLPFHNPTALHDINKVHIPTQPQISQPRQ